jgi:hypothetical protein
MQVTGIQPVGARSFGTVQATVTDTQLAVRESAAVGDRAGPSTFSRPAIPEAVVFPHDGKPLDQRPTQLRHARARARYRADGGEPRHRNPPR